MLQYPSKLVRADFAGTGVVAAKNRSTANTAIRGAISAIARSFGRSWRAEAITSTPSTLLDGGSPCGADGCAGLLLPSQELRGALEHRLGHGGRLLDQRFDRGAALRADHHGVLRRLIKER